MSDVVYSTLDFLLTQCKGHKYRLDRAVPLHLLFGTIIRRFCWMVRGAGKCLVLQGRIRFVYMAPHVNLRNRTRIRFGKGITLERGAVIDGLSRDGVEFGDNVVIGAYSVVRA